MGALINCETTTRNTGLIDPTFRADMYSICTATMNKLLAKEGIQVNVLRKQIKEAQMTHFYNSKAKPREIFGEDTIELQKFYEAQQIVAPGACKVMEIFQSLWNRDARVHEWTLPDGFHARVKVMYTFDKSIEVDEMMHSSFTHRFKENLTTREFEKAKKDYERDGISLPANITHSVDGLLVRELGRRCNYDPKKLKRALSELRSYLREKTISTSPDTSKFISLVHAENLSKAITELSTDDLQRLEWLIEETLQYRNFEMLAVHDEFKAHPNHINRLRYWYKEIMAELAESNLLEDICSQLLGKTVTITKMGNIADKIRNSNYGLS